MAGRWAFLALLLIPIAFVFWSLVSRPINLTYLNDYYDHSQWRIPLSNRIISDGELYIVSGWRLVHGDAVFATAPEVPPLMKSIYGLSTLYLGHPYWAALNFTIGMVIVTYFLALKVGLSKKQAWWSAAILAISPMVYSQTWQAMLDAPLTFWFLLFLLTFISGLSNMADKSMSKTKTYAYVSSSGIFLSLMANTKVPLLIPIIFLLVGWLLRKQWRMLLLFCISFFVTWLAGYFQFFLQGGNIWQFIQAEKWVVAQYASGKVSNSLFMALVTTITGWYQGWWNEPGEWTRTYSLYWPVSLVAMLFWRPRNKNDQVLNWFGLILLAVYCVIAFWPRYLLLILPIMVIQLVGWLGQKSERWLWLVLLLLILQNAFYLNPQPANSLNLASQRWANGSYQDFYQHLAPSSINLDQIAFNQKLKQFHATAGTIESTLAFKPPFVWPWQTKVTAPIEFDMLTSLGEWHQKEVATLTRNGNNWNIEWNWQFLANDMSQDATFSAQVIYPKTGRIILQDETIIAFPGTVQDIYVSPAKVGDDQQLRILLGQAIGVGNVDIEAKLFVDADGLEVVNIGTIDSSVDPKILSELASSSAVTLVPRPGLELNEIGKAKGVIFFVKKMMNDHPELLGKTGGNFTLFNPKSNTPTVLIERDVVDGQDLIDETISAENLKIIYATE